LSSSNHKFMYRDAGTGGGGGGRRGKATAPLALYQEGQGGRRWPFD
jgi:hypothetical protein